MPQSSRLVLTGVLAVALTSTAGVGAASAAPVAHRAPARHAVSHRPVHHRVDPTARELSARLAQLGRLGTRVARAAVYTDADRASVQTALAADRAAVQADADAVAATSTGAGRRALVRSADNTLRIAGLQVGLVAVADRTAARGTAEAAVVATLSAQVAAAAADPTSTVDTATAQADLDDATGRLGTVGTATAAAGAVVLAVAPTATRADQRSAGAAAGTALRQARVGLGAVQADITAVQALLGS